MIRKKKEKKHFIHSVDIQSTTTDTTTTTSGQAIEDVFGEDSEFKDIVKEREKPLFGKYCPNCKKWVSSFSKKCPDCDTDLE